MTRHALRGHEVKNVSFTRLCDELGYLPTQVMSISLQPFRVVVVYHDEGGIHETHHPVVAS